VLKISYKSKYPLIVEYLFMIRRLLKNKQLLNGETNSKLIVVKR